MRAQSVPAATLEEELLRLLARRGRQIPVPVVLISVMIAALAYGRVPTAILGTWVALVAFLQVFRFIALRRLAERTDVPARGRLRTAVILSGINGLSQGLCLAFFPFLPEFERALQSMLLVGLCTGAVSTSAGYMPLFLVYALSMLGPLTLLWAFSPGVPEAGWIEMSTAAIIGTALVVLIALARDAHRLFHESFSIRLQHEDLNRQLNAALEEAEAASRAKTRFLASASHDLRQPIHTLSLFGAALIMRSLDGASREIAQHMNTALQVLASQLDALLDISKLDAGVVHVNPAPVNLRLLLERISRDFDQAARVKKLDFVLECADNAFVLTDQVLLERILRNLLDNAVKYTDAGSIRLQARPDGDTFVVTIADSGRGIPEDEQERVFDEFYQVDNPERDRTRGLGLGLAIVRRIANLLQLRLEMHSAPGVGTTFHLHVRAVEHSADGTLGPVVTRTAPGGVHVLVVDDEALIRLGMKTLLEEMGCRATLADGTEQAVAAARAVQPDMVLTDLRLRGTDNGIRTIRAIRELYPSMPAILISGDTAPERLREAEAAGIPLLHKPVPVELLKQVIAQRNMH